MKSVASHTWLPSIMTLLLAGCGASHAEPPAPAAPAAPPSLSTPPAAEIPTIGDEKPPAPLVVPGLVEDEASYSILLPGHVFPVGWSPGGLFAYVYEPPDEACGCYFFHLVVQDLTNNKVVWEHRYESGPLEGDDSKQLTSLSAVWSAQGPALSAKLAALGIVRRHERALHPFGAASGLQVHIPTTEVPEATSIFGFPYLGSYRVDLTSASGPQTVFQTAFGEPGAPQTGPLQVTSPGYLRSPYGGHIAALLLETWRGWEGLPHVAQLRFAGANPEAGSGG